MHVVYLASILSVRKQTHLHFMTTFYYTSQRLYFKIKIAYVFIHGGGLPPFQI